MRRLHAATPFAGLSGNLDYTNRLAVALFLSASLHLFVIFALHFELPAFRKLANPPPLEVVLVNSKSAAAPLKADALAQANLEGGGNTDLDRRAKSPLPVMNQDQPESAVEQSSRRVREMEQQAQQLMTQLKSTRSTAPAQAIPQPAEEKVDAPNTSNLAQKSLQMASRLEARIARSMDDYNGRPRRNFYRASTAKYDDAQYVEDWRIKVERVGNLNYPEAAKQQKLYGYLRLTVTIRSDGTVESIEIDRPSGQKVLDAAARRIVELAAPYAAFTADMRKRMDTFSITRTFTFTSADRLASGSSD